VLDLDVGDRKYLSKDSDTSKQNRYKLHSVLVHSGGTHGGHYYAYSRPDGRTWLRFDDEKVFSGALLCGHPQCEAASCCGARADVTAYATRHLMHSGHA
jgi:Ubiquitin carboxyl-terminal hydrolase